MACSFLERWRSPSFREATNGQEATAEQEPLFVNYGTGASIRQGDNDHHQAIYLSVPAGTPGPLYVRIFDPDTFNFHDQMDKRAATTQTRFTVFGGDGALHSRADRSGGADRS